MSNGPIHTGGAGRASLRRFLTGYSCSAIATGLQIVLLPWLAISLVNITPIQLGWLQAAVLLPNLVFLLPAGALADRVDPARISTGAALLLGFCHLLFGFYISGGDVVLGALFAYAISLGTATALLQPARDGLVSRVTRDRGDTGIQDTVTWMLLVQYGGQAIGILLAGLFDRIGAPPLLFIQAALLALTASSFFLLRNRAPAEMERKHAPMLQSVRSGLALVWRTHTLRTLVLLVAFNGLVHIGVFLVVMPLLAASYTSEVSYYAGLQLSFIAGTVVASLMLLKRGQGSSPGRGIAMCLLYSAAILLAISFGPTPLGLVLLSCCWGAVAASSAALGRALVQILAPAEFRSRVISIYQLALFGSAAIGALLAGWISNFSAPLGTMLWAAIASLVAFVCLLFSRGLLSVRVDVEAKPD
ncbi:MFS transporter [Biformimicrobium ophioploci]|uniref:MFS transporter n=1 Tax=Biformimicrobium ophioploci TaxID=3036711 RepID=A0ABQ6LZG1_9GAMM|nr:MFS transporter [Microbulbifer sp. NKW57]GMG87476.1 MFS transporter [Microbulbifer sp. NKW57]